MERKVAEKDAALSVANQTISGPQLSVQTAYGAVNEPTSGATQRGARRASCARSCQGTHTTTTLSQGDG